MPQQKPQNLFRLEIDSLQKSSEEKVLEKKIRQMGYNIKLRVSHVYSIKHDFLDIKPATPPPRSGTSSCPERSRGITSEVIIQKIADALHNKLVQNARINQPLKEKFNWALELGFLPGVTDNVANTTTEIINDLLKTNIGPNKVFTSKVLFITTRTDHLRGVKKDMEFIAQNLINTLIERYHLKSYQQYRRDKGMDYHVPVVRLSQKPKVLEIDLNVSDDKLAELGKKGIYDPQTKTRRGPLALDLDYLYAIKKYYKKIGRQPTDIELESIAQTWSEHCKHTGFAARIDEVKDGLYQEFIKRATSEIRKEMGKNDFCVSVFEDNSGAIIFDDDHLITDKVETHNSPSALDPFGGAITGIVGVNRDTIGFGLGAKPIANRYGFCFGHPKDKTVIYRGKNKQNPALPPRKIMDGVIEGVNAGGNCSGIPTPQGFAYFDDSYQGKPLVFVGTVGLIPRKINGKPSHKKAAQPGDNIVVIGGRVGKDGIHGATFSSEALSEGSPATAVQIGDPITQKKLSDTLVKEARHKNLYNSITDNGAGGLSCSVAEMAKESGGFVVDLEKVPLKYPGLQPWEIWISESQERMTLAVPDDKLTEFNDLMKSRGVEATVIGKFNKGGQAVVEFRGQKILDLKMDFLHEGLPKREFDSQPYPYKNKEPKIKVKNQQQLLEKILGSHNNSSFEFISKQYDHEVQGSSVIKPLQGKGRVNGQATVIKPVFSSGKGVVLSQALYPRLSEVSSYDMAACAIDSAVRNAVAVGANIDHLALLDNFCWCSSNEPERLAQLKDAARACYELAIIYQTPFISGKDSMFNDFKGFDEKNQLLKISVLPTLLISSIAVVDDIRHTQTMDFKIPGDLIYIIGQTKNECAGSEFYQALGKIGANSPKVKAQDARRLYQKIYQLHQSELPSAIASVAQGGLLIALTKMAIAGQLGAEIDLTKIPNDHLSTEKIFYSESQSRFILTIDPKSKSAFEKEMKCFIFAKIGKVIGGNRFLVKQRNKNIINTNISRLTQVYRKRFKNF